MSLEVAGIIVLTFVSWRRRSVIYICSACRKLSTTPMIARLCDSCSDRVNESFYSIENLHLVADSKNVPLYSLFSYSPVIRQLILDAKVSGEKGALETLSLFFTQWHQCNDLIKGVDRIMPIPASPWSRWYGKTDLAFISPMRSLKGLRFH